MNKNDLQHIAYSKDHQSRASTWLSSIKDIAEIALDGIASEFGHLYRKIESYARNYRVPRQDSSVFSLGSQLVSSGAWALPAAGLATAGVFREEISRIIDDIFGNICNFYIEINLMNKVTN